MTYGWKTVTTPDADNPDEGDLMIVNRSFVRIAGQVGLSAFGERVAQSVRVHFRWWRSEWFLDTRRGVPYLEDLLGGRVATETIRVLVRREALLVAGVADVPEITVSRDIAARLTTIDLSITTTEGELVAVTSIPFGSA